MVAKKIDHSEFFDEYHEWQFEQENKAEYWQERFKEEALKEPTWGKALKFIADCMPDLPDDFVLSTERSFINWNREFITDAKNDLWNEIKKVEIEHDDKHTN